MSDDTDLTNFRDLGLIEPVLKALDAIGYETPSPIQAHMIPYVLDGRDVIGQAQTGTGKTAAFALPLLSRINVKLNKPQVLVLAPTRELAIQVAEAFQKYAAKMKGFHILPIYGGQDYRGQLQTLKRGVHVVVGTPGRVMDHIRRGTLNLDALSCLVLDEADEMLRMGFIDDVEWVLEQTPAERQVALFSATMPTAIRRIAQKHLSDPKEITIKMRTTTAETIRQRVWMVSGVHKLDALTRILEAEMFEAMIVFVRTKTLTSELSEKLNARGFAAAPLNGDISQHMRERTVTQLKNGKLDILVATDVAARGLDVERITHVINYDIPYDTESYVHRIGRTGRAGRKGEAILFASPRERRMLRNIENATRQKIEPLELPSTEVINDVRIARFKQRITDTLATEELGFFYQLIEQYQHEHNVPALEIAAGLASLLQGDTPLLLAKKPDRKRARTEAVADERGSRRGSDRERERKRSTPDRRPAERGRETDRSANTPVSDIGKASEGMERFRLAVGATHGVKPGNIVGAIANEAGLESQYIQNVAIHEDHSTVDLPEGMPRDIFKALKKTWVLGQQLELSKLDEKPRTGIESEAPRRAKAGKPGKDKPRAKLKLKKPAKVKQKDKGARSGNSKATRAEQRS